MRRRYAQDDANLGVSMQEIGHHLRQERLRDRHRHANPHTAARRITQAMHDIDSGLGFGQHRLAMLVEELAGLGQCKFSRGPLHQTHAERRLKLRHAPRQTRLGNTQHPLRRRETAVLDNVRKIHQIIEVMRIRFHAAGLSLGFSLSHRWDNPLRFDGFFCEIPPI
jgi:hypothetical protein